MITTTKVWKMSGIGVVTALCLVLCGVSVHAAEGGERSKSGKSGKGGEAPPQIDQKTGAKLNKALEFLNTERYNEAREVLEKLNRDRLSPYELARVETILAAIAQGQEQLSKAREHLRKAIESGGLNEQEMSSTQFQIAQLWLAEEKWKEGIEALKGWFASGATPNSNAYYLLAVAYYQLRNYGSAVEPAQKAIDLTDRPQESWLQLLLALRLEREEHEKALPLLHKLLQIAPGKKTYWMQLSGVYGLMERYGEALVPMQLAYQSGLLTANSEYRRLADLAIHQGIPYRAALLLTKAIEEKKIEGDAKDWEKLGNAWIAARHYDKAVGPLTRAASMSETGDLYVRLAEIQTQREDWPATIEALNRGLQKGKLRNTSEALLLMGVALYNQHKFKDARSYFQRASEDAKTRVEAQRWLRYIESELRS